MPAAITAARARAKIFFIVSFPPFHVFNPGGLSIPAFRLQCHYTPPRTLSTVFCNSFVTDLSLYEKSPGQAGCFGADLGGMHRKQAIWVGSCRRGVFHIPLWKRRKKDVRAAKKPPGADGFFRGRRRFTFQRGRRPASGPRRWAGAGGSCAHTCGRRCSRRPCRGSWPGSGSRCSGWQSPCSATFCGCCRG